MLIAGVILAAGQSKRMGTNKAQLLFKGKRLIDHMASQLNDLQLPVYVSGHDEHYESLPDPIRFQGPLYGIYNSIEELRLRNYTAALFVPVDMPLLTKEVLSKLIQENKNVDMTYYDQHPLPLFITFTPSILDDVSCNFPDLKFGTSLYSYIKRHRVKQYHVENSIQNTFINVNTPDVLHSILES